MWRHSNKKEQEGTRRNKKEQEVGKEEQQEVDQVFNLLPKKEASLRAKDLEKLRRQLNGIKNMTKVPDVAIIVDQKRETTAIRECRKLGITVISLLDTNCDPDLVDIPIPANDDGVRSIKLILQSLADSIIRGQSKFLSS